MIDEPEPQSPAAGTPPEPSIEDAMLARLPKRVKRLPRPRKSKVFTKRKSQASGKPRLRKDGTPVRKATDAEAEERTYVTAQMIAGQIPKHQIIRYLKDKYKISHRQAENYIARGRAWLVEASSLSKDEMKSVFHEFYLGIIRNPDFDKWTASHRLEAVASLRQMHGIDQPTKIASTTPEGESSVLPVGRMTTEELEFLFKLRQRIENERQLPPQLSDQRHQQNGGADRNGAAHRNGELANGTVIDVEASPPPA
jgi:hypothetical protein